MTSWKDGVDPIDFPCAPQYVTALAHEGNTTDYPREFYASGNSSREQRPAVGVRSLERRIDAQDRYIKRLERRLLQVEKRLYCGGG